jgi:uncharacterized protein (DUF433 family)
MDRTALLERITSNPAVCGGMPCIRGTRIPVAVVVDAVAEGLSAEQVIDHYPHLTADDVRGALTYAGELVREGAWKLAV